MGLHAHCCLAASHTLTAALLHHTLTAVLLHTLCRFFALQGQGSSCWGSADLPFKYLPKGTCITDPYFTETNTTAINTCPGGVDLYCGGGQRQATQGGPNIFSLGVYMAVKNGEPGAEGMLGC